MGSPKSLARVAAFLVVGKLLLCISSSVSFAGDFDLLPSTGIREPRWMVGESLLAEAERLLAARDQSAAEMKSKDAVLHRQNAIQNFLRTTFEPWPERTPLNAQVTGKIARDDFQIEKVMYESRPNFHVTATLYLPNDSFPRPVPGVLIPCGHSMEGKAFFMEQRIGMLLAKHGIAALCYDPIGQGERYQLPGSPQGMPRYRTTCEHTYAGAGALLIGRHSASDHVWDGIRSLDYLLSRPEVDSKRIGCTGNSGGGNMTSFLMAIDPRIHVAMPVCWLTQYRPLLRSRGPQDAEQNLNGFLAAGFDKGDFVLARLPRPTMVGAGIKDSTFDIAGVRNIVRESKTACRLLAGSDDSVELAEANEEHGFTQPLREATVRWFCRWFFQRDVAIQEPNLTEFLDRELWVTPNGSVTLLDGERTVYNVHAEEAAQLRIARDQSNDQKKKLVEQRNSLRQLLGLSSWNELKSTAQIVAAPLARGDLRIERIVLKPAADITLPALAFVPKTWNGNAVLLLHSLGKASVAEVGGSAETMAKTGTLVLAVDPRGVGETASQGMSRLPPFDWSRNLFDANVQEVILASLLGKSLVALQTNDILSAAKFLRGEARELLKLTPGRNIGHLQIDASGNIGVAALHAAFFEPQQIDSLTLRQSLSSWEELVKARRPHGQFATIVPGALKYYDLPELVGALPPNFVQIVNPLNPMLADETPTYADYLTDEQAMAGWIAVFDGESDFGFRQAKKEFNGTHAILRGGVTTTQFSDYELLANVVEPGTILLSDEAHQVRVGRVHLQSRGRRGAIDLGSTVVASLMLRPLQLRPLFNGKDLTNWQPSVSPKLPPNRHPKWKVENGAIRAIGGPGALEYAPAGGKNLFDDFLIQMNVRTRSTHTNGGLFVRNQPGTTMMGYEAQIHNRWYFREKGETGCWTGSIDDRQDGRRLVTLDHVPFRMTVIAHGNHLAIWVNGYQQTDWNDERAPHENPRKGCRIEPGTIQLQAHDPQTDIDFQQIWLQELAKEFAP